MLWFDLGMNDLDFWVVMFGVEVFLVGIWDEMDV